MIPNNVNNVDLLVFFLIINKDNILVIIVTNEYFVFFKFTFKLYKLEGSEKGQAKVLNSIRYLFFFFLMGLIKGNNPVD